MLRKEIYAVSVRGDCFPRQRGRILAVQNRKRNPRRRRGYRPAKPDIVHTQCGYRYSRIRREERKGIHRETPGGSCISPCSEKKFMPFLCGGIVFPDKGGGFWPCRIGNEIHAFGVDDIPGRAPGRYLRLTAQGSCDYIEARDFSPEGRGFSQCARDCRAARHRENEIRPQSGRTKSTPAAWTISCCARRYPALRAGL